MGKKRQLKALRQIADQLPAMKTTGLAKSRVTGAELIESGTLFIGEGENRQLVDPHVTYVQSDKVQVPVNHKRRIKKLFDKHGAGGIKGYVGYVHNVMEKANKEAADKTEQTTELHGDLA